MSPFGGWESKLKQLTVSAISHDSLLDPSCNKENQKQQVKTNQNNQKTYLEEILDDQGRIKEEQELMYLQQKL